jgi:hypothetical protein
MTAYPLASRELQLPGYLDKHLREALFSSVNVRLLDTFTHQRLNEFTNVQ